MNRRFTSPFTACSSTLHVLCDTSYSKVSSARGSTSAKVSRTRCVMTWRFARAQFMPARLAPREARPTSEVIGQASDRKSTRLNSRHGYISYSVFCLKKKKKTKNDTEY